MSRQDKTIVIIWTHSNEKDSEITDIIYNKLEIFNSMKNFYLVFFLLSVSIHLRQIEQTKS